MTYKDIPQLTSIGSYTVNQSLRHLKNWMKDHLKDGLEMNPDFQRGHVWTENQQIKYVEFLLRGGKTNNVIYFNHPGWMTDFEGEFVCVDGLQRITALMRFINDEIKCFDTLYSEFEGGIPQSVGIIINVNNLQTRKEVLTWYLEMNS